MAQRLSVDTFEAFLGTIRLAAYVWQRSNAECCPNQLLDWPVPVKPAGRAAKVPSGRLTVRMGC